MLLTTTATTATSPTTTLSSYEGVCQKAFPSYARLAKYSTMCMITLVCFMGAIGQTVILRDLCIPIADWIHSQQAATTSTTTHWETILMLAVVFVAVTPLCTLKTVTSLQNVGIFSLASIMILGSCIVYRSLQCLLTGSPNNRTYTLEHAYIHPNHTSSYHLLSLFPKTVQDFLEAFPLILNCFFCQFNAIPVYSELSNPTSRRVSFLSKAVILLASFFYMTIGIFGSLFGAKCNTPNANIVSGNILLDFDDDDPVVTMGRICLGITITFAIPLQVIPARDTLVRLIQEIVDHRSSRKKKRQSNTNNYSDNPQDLLEPLLEESSTENNGINISNSDEVFQRFLVMTQQQQHQQQMERNPLLRKFVGVTLLWSAASIATRISSVALVWDLLGSSLVIIIGFILPSILYLRICCDEDTSLLFWKSSFSCKRLLALGMIILYTPLMICCTINVIRMNFFRSQWL
jgi:amino acid permease